MFQHKQGMHLDGYNREPIQFCIKEQEKKKKKEEKIECQH